MALRQNVLCFAIYGLTGTATAQPAPTSENWFPVNSTANTITGRVTFAPTEITFQNGRSLSPARGGQMLFRAVAKKRKVMADLYKVTSSDDPGLESANRLCKGKSVAYLIVWKSDKVGNEADPRTLALFSGPKLTAGSPAECGRYVYDAGQR